MISALAFIALAQLTAPDVNVKSLLPEMTDLARLAHRASPTYTMAQASSYDRNSKAPGDEAWFANADYGQYDRTEQHGDRTEYVMADLKGPGAVVRIWSANPSGTIRFYFDGEATPRFSAKMADLLTGKFEGLGDPFAYMASRGTDLYFPFPYAKSLVITSDDSDEGAKRLYYHVGYRTYTGPATVATFTPGDIKANAALMKRLGEQLLDPSKLPAPAGALTAKAEWKLAPNATEVLDMPEGPGEVVALSIRVKTNVPDGAAWTDPAQPHNVLRHVLLNIQADDEGLVASPLGDFFGAAPGIVPYRSLPLEVAADGTMTSRWVMPYKQDMVVILSNIGPTHVDVPAEAKARKAPFDAGTYYFRAGWGGENGSTRPHHDMTLLNATGEGAWVGSMLHVANLLPDWWGEGDEKVFVDGEAFPSTFGTGTEDYYGYAWCSNEPFQRPYHGQPLSGTPGNRGHTVVNRWHIFDQIPFRKSLRFDLENWHWADSPTGFLHTAYWYSAPGGSAPGSIRHELLPVPEIAAPVPIKGAIEGETLTIESHTGGETEAQEGFWQISSGKQLWWKAVAVGDKLSLRVPVPKAGRYEVIGNFCKASDYGIHQITINGKPAGGPIDFYSPTMKWERKSLGVFDLTAGDVTFGVECKGKHYRAVPSRMFGLDYLLLESR